MLKIEGLDTGYGQSQILWNVHLEVPPGELVCLLGRNGVGKTTLLKTVMGLVRPWKGSLLFKGRNLAGIGPDGRARMGIGYVPQGRELFPDLSVEENLYLGLIARGRRQRSVPEGVFHLFPALRQWWSRKGGVLSGGQQQQVAIARALVTEPGLLLLDEPTEGIQPSIILEIKKALHHLKSHGGLSILLVEQYLEFARELADYFYVLEKGAIVLEGPGSDLRKESVRTYLAI